MAVAFVAFQKVPVAAQLIPLVLVRWMVDGKNANEVVHGVTGNSGSAQTDLTNPAELYRQAALGVTMLLDVTLRSRPSLALTA